MSYCIIQTRQEISEIVKNISAYVQKNCMCCNFCFHCKILINLKKEISSFNLLNSDIRYWSIEWLLKNKELKPFLKYYVLDGNK